MKRILISACLLGCSCRYDGGTKPCAGALALKEKYQLIEGYNMTLEAATAKLMWALGQTKDPKEIKTLFYRTVQNDLIR